MNDTDEMAVRFVETILTGESAGHKIDDGIVGNSQYETQQMRAEWVRLWLPKTAGLNGVEWDGVKRLGGRKE